MVLLIETVELLFNLFASILRLYSNFYAAAVQILAHAQAYAISQLSLFLVEEVNNNEIIHCKSEVIFFLKIDIVFLSLFASQHFSAFQ